MSPYLAGNGSLADKETRYPSTLPPSGSRTGRSATEIGEKCPNLPILVTPPIIVSRRRKNYTSRASCPVSAGKMHASPAVQRAHYPLSYLTPAIGDRTG